MSSVTKMMDFHLEALSRDASQDEQHLQITSRIPASLKIRLDLCADFLGMTRNAFLIELLEAALPEAEQSLRDAELTKQSFGSTSWGPYSYDEAASAFIESYRQTGKQFSSLSNVNDLLQQAQAEFSETGEVSQDTKDDLLAAGYPLRFIEEASK